MATLALLSALAASLLAGCAAPRATGSAPAAVSGSEFIVVAVAERPAPRLAAGGAARADYRQAQAYGNDDDAVAQAARVAADHDLQEVAAWSIAPLQWRCMLYRLARGAQQGATLARLASDPRVQLAQPLNEFETLATPPSLARSEGPAYNDPYLSLQAGFAAIDAAGAQRLSRGQGMTVAIIDTAIDARHPDLQAAGSIERDFVGGRSGDAASERHGTAVAGVIAAAANNGIGIVGVAPGARLLALRACWSADSGDAPARCNTFTLAQALAAAMAGGADIVNLSLGGPRDALLERLAEQAMARGIVIVGATPPGGRRAGFPTALPGVLAVSSDHAAAAPDVLGAPGLRVLTLAPGGGYDYASGSSLAAAHVSGAVALLRALDRSLSSATAQALLADGGPTIDACRALQRLRPALSAGCTPRR